MRSKVYLMLAVLLVLSGGCAHTRGPEPEGPLCFPGFVKTEKGERAVFECQYPDGKKETKEFFEIPMLCEPKDSYLKYLDWCGTCN